MINNPIVYDYDYANDSLFIYCNESYTYNKSLELDNNVILDFDVNNKPVAFEFLNASKVFKLDKNFFKNLVHIGIHAGITKETISLKVQLIVPIHNKNQIFDIKRITSNLNNIPAMETELASV